MATLNGTISEAEKSERASDWERALKLWHRVERNGGDCSFQIDACKLLIKIKWMENELPRRRNV